MLSALNEQGEVVVAWEVNRELGSFFCPGCQEAVILKKGVVNIHHFAHYPDSSCIYGTGESVQHRQAKYEIYEALRTHTSISNLKVERYLGDVRPDVSFCWEGKYEVAIEFQISSISPDEIQRRTCSYTRKRMWVLWMTSYHHNVNGLTPYRTNVWERYLHALYFGKLYYWVRGETLLPVHFEPYVTGTALQRRYDEDAQKWNLELVDKFSPVLRNLDLNERVNITDLKAITRPSWKMGSFSLPYARLWSLPGQRG